MYENESKNVSEYFYYSFQSKFELGERVVVRISRDAFCLHEEACALKMTELLIVSGFLP
jgi:hypothetical protein